MKKAASVLGRVFLGFILFLTLVPFYLLLSNSFKWSEEIVKKPFTLDVYKRQPLNGAPTGLIYDKNLFEKNGWEVPVTWDQFFELGDKAKEQGIALFTYQGIYPNYLANILLPSIESAVGEEGFKKITSYQEGDVYKRQLGTSFGASLGGAIIAETVFAMPGMGTLITTAIRQKDIPVVMGATLDVYKRQAEERRICFKTQGNLFHAEFF